MAELPITFGTLIDRLRTQMEDYPPRTTLSVAITDVAATTLSLTDPTIVAPDTRIEVDSEVMRVTADPQGANPVSVERAFIGSAATHLINARVLVDPRWPKVSLAEALNVSLQNWFSFYVPRLVWDKTTAGAFTPVRSIYAVPADTLSVERVMWQIPGRYGMRDVSFNPISDYDTTIVSTGKGVQVHELGMSGRTVHLYLAKRWTFSESDSAEALPSDFPAEADELIVAGAALYLAGWRDLPRYRLDEAMYRKRSGDAQEQAGVTRLAIRAQDWAARARQVAARRPTTRRKIFVGGRP